MTANVIEVEHLEKRYQLGELADTAACARRGGAGRKARRRMSRGDAREEVWSLRDLSFEVGEGEAVGVIGRNGAGKSTLLKVLTRITEPTSGLTRTCGRVGSLLEVGTGFHPELTGRENVYLNGVDPRHEPPRHDRSGSTRSSTSPASPASSTRRSSATRRACSCGSRSRSPRTWSRRSLVVDEVLAVGDAEFQRKCLGKMQDVGAGRPYRRLRQPRHGRDRTPVLARHLARQGHRARRRWAGRVDRPVLELGRAGCTAAAGRGLVPGPLRVNDIRLVDRRR